LNETTYSNDMQVLNVFCNPGDVHTNVLLPGISYDIPVGKSVPAELKFAPLGVNFTNQSLPVSNVVGEAISNVGTLTATIQINGVGELVGYSTGQATLNVLQNGSINWFTPGFEEFWATSFGVPTPKPLGNTGPLGFQTKLDELGLKAAGTSFDTIIRTAESYIHQKLSDLLFKDLITEFSIVDPGQTDLLITDQNGNQTGKLSDGTIVQQIPGSAYFPDYPLIVIAAPQSGVYKTQVQGRSLGKYLLVTSLSDGSQLRGSESASGVIAQGQLIVYSMALDLSSNGSTIIQVSHPIPPFSSGFGAGRDAFVRTLYLEDLGRPPESSGLRFWSGVLFAGVKPKTVAVAIWNSPEHRTLVKQHLAPGIPFRRSYADALFAGRQAARLRRSKSASRST
jgi:Domain of unknown function (DUF4214)